MKSSQAAARSGPPKAGHDDRGYPPERILVINGLGFAEVNTSYWMLMAEGGYDFGVAKHLVLRPVVVLGVVEEAVRACSNVGCLKRSDSDAGFGFGGHVLYFVTSLVSVGGQVRAVLTGPEAVLFGIQVGGVL